MQTRLCAREEAHMGCSRLAGEIASVTAQWTMRVILNLPKAGGSSSRCPRAQILSANDYWSDPAWCSGGHSAHYFTGFILSIVLKFIVMISVSKNSLKALKMNESPLSLYFFYWAVGCSLACLLFAIFTPPNAGVSRHLLFQKWKYQL